MSSVGVTWLSSLGLLLLGMTLLWGVSVPLRNASIVDLAWGPAFAIIGGLYAWLGPGGGARGVLAMVLVTAWATRLFVHLASRNLGHGEDPRYAAWRAETGASFWWRSLFKVFLLQGALVGVISAPLLALATAPAEAPGVLAALGATVFAVGLFFEAVGDAQLAAFKRDPANKGVVMDRGLWKYTRHPNYFGDACAWWGIFIIALEAPWGWLTFPAPALMTFLLLRVSGVVLLEKGMQKTRPGYAEYARRTSAFIPWFPRRTA